MNNFMVDLNLMEMSYVNGGNQCVVAVTITYPNDETKAAKINELSEVLVSYNNDFGLFEKNIAKASIDIGVNLGWKANCLSNPVSFVVN